MNETIEFLVRHGAMVLTEAFSYRDGDIYIVGGANSAGQAAMCFSKFARQVTMLVRGDSLSDTMSQYLEDQIAATKNITVRINSSVIAVEGVGLIISNRIVADHHGGEIEFESRPGKTRSKVRLALAHAAQPGT